MENTHQKGLLSKISVMRHYTQKGWYVYNETMGTGPIDIVIVNPNTGEVRFIDVKTMFFAKIGGQNHWKPKPNQHVHL